MQRKTKPRNTFLAAFVVALLALGGLAGQAQATTLSGLSCQRITARASRAYIREILGARQDCLFRVLEGRISPLTDCISGTGDPDALAAMDKAAARLSARLPRRCEGIDLTQIGFPGICPDLTGPPFGVVDLEQCILAMMDENAQDLLNFEYPLLTGVVEKRERHCIDNVGRRSRRMVVRELRARHKCLDWLSQFEFEDLSCRSDIEPFGTGTNSEKYDRPIRRARIHQLAGIPEGCRTVNIDAQGWDDDCMDFTGGAFSIVDLQLCQRDSHVPAVRSMLQVAYPTGAECGNGIVEDIEECDDGNASNADSCLNDCTASVCGDGILCTDASCTSGPNGGPETCDDGNFSAGDSCTNQCAEAACGDGFACTAAGCTSGPGGGPEACDDGNTNNNDACMDDCKAAECGDGFVRFGAEDCDDGNQSNSDSCLNDCFFASCGDGFMCTANDCISGPGGGAEECDDANAVNTDFCKDNCELFRCGDGFLFPDAEECDDGNTVDGDGCTSTCESEGCGDGVVQAGEFCDDANTEDCDACPNSCLAEGCGDGVTKCTDECDDGNQIDNDGCTNACTLPVCGDGIVNGSDQCDDGNSVPLDGCENDCSTTPPPNCGNGVVDVGEQCDDGNQIDTDACRNNCVPSICGDGIVNGTDECDDNNQVDDDGCTNGCKLPVCGDGIVNGTDECDDNNQVDDDGCTNGCKLPVCGDGIVNDTDECDDGNQTDDDGCTNGCKLPVCGDGIVNGTDGCDDGNQIDGDACTNACTVAACGDGSTCSDAACTSGPGGGVEGCDDGNTADNDGCSAVCQLEGCGDGIVQTGEACDDGTANGATAPCLTDCTVAACGDGSTCSDAACTSGAGGGVEGCDDGNQVDDDGCTNACTLPVCGDGIINGSDLCDDGAANADTAPCLSGCTVAACGDGNVCSDAACTTGPGGAPEDCDDGGASATCTAQCEDIVVAGACPDLGMLEFFGRVGEDCTSNADCRPAGKATCDLSIGGKCRTLSDLDTGWTGIAHDADILDQVFVGGTLSCPGTGGNCGTCDVTGIDPFTNNCRCANDVTIICNEPFSNDQDDCGGAACECFLGAPLPLSSGNVPACVTNKFAEDVFGTANVDLGESQITAKLRSVVYTGPSAFLPCPVCAGNCTSPVQGEGACRAPSAALGDPCSSSADCVRNGQPGNCRLPFGLPCVRDVDCDLVAGDATGTCGNFDGTPRDGVRGGTCFEGARHGLACDGDAASSTFPAFQQFNGGFLSFDCPPEVGRNISGTGLQIDLKSSTGRQELARVVDCGLPVSFPPFVQVDCACRVCSGSVPGANIPCNTHAECAAVGAGTCSVNSATGIGGSGANSCNNKVANGGDGFSTGSCVEKAGETAGINGECQTAVDDLPFCDAIVRADGSGFVACDPTPRCSKNFNICTTNADCTDPTEFCSGDADCLSQGTDAGACSLRTRKSCFLDPIVAVGVSDPSAPLGVATFCVPPTINDPINAVAGLPGPGRVSIQTESTLFCSSDRNVQYVPGQDSCP